MKCLIILTLTGCSAVTSLTPIEFINNMADKGCEFRAASISASDNKHGSQFEVQTVCKETSPILTPSFYEEKF